MPTSFSIYPSLRLSVFRMEGTITVAEGKRCFVSYTDHPDFDASYTMVTDARAVTEVEASFQEILFGASSILQQILRVDPGTAAIVIVQKESVFAMARMLEQVVSFLSRIQMRVVTSLADASTLMGEGGFDLGEVLAGRLPSGQLRAV